MVGQRVCHHGLSSRSLFPPTLIADWLVSRLNGNPFKSERWFVEPTGRIATTAL
jgi:hypothetical protein